MKYIPTNQFEVRAPTSRSASIQQRLTEKRKVGDEFFRIGEMYLIARIVHKEDKFYYSFINIRTKEAVEREFGSSALADGLIDRLLGN